MHKYEPEIKDYLIREIDLLPFNQCKVDILTKPDYNNPPMGCFSLDKDGNPVAQFYTEVIKDNIGAYSAEIIRKGGVQKFIQRIVRHECRHYMQYEYMKENGIDYNNILDIENKFQYGDGPLEKDAKDFANGVVNDLAKMVKEFYTESKRVEEPVKEESNITIETPKVEEQPVVTNNTKKKKRRKK